jgi:hypothetical protein
MCVLIMVVTPCSPVGGYERFGRTCYLHLHHIHLDLEDGDSMFLRNVDNYQQCYTVY